MKKEIVDKISRFLVSRESLNNCRPRVYDPVKSTNYMEKSAPFGNWSAYPDETGKPAGKWKESLNYQQPLGAGSHDNPAQPGCFYFKDQYRAL